MFGWQSRPDRDAVAAAQRRLAAIAASFEPPDDGRDGPEGLDGHRSDNGSDGFAGDGPSTAGAAPEGSTGSWTDLPEGRAARTGSATAARHLSRSRALPGGRLTISPHHVALVALAVVVMVSLAAWWVLRSVPHTQPVQLSSQRTLPGSTAPVSTSPSPVVATATASPSGGLPVAPAPTAGASAAGSVVVDVAGRVRRPGIVELPAGARVIDALRAAGGARPGVQTRSLNLARPLVDGEQIVVGLHVPEMAGGSTPSTPPTTGSSIAPVDLNTATAEQLDTLPGIGPVTAQAILTWRTQNGSFTSVDELLEVSGIGDATLADIAPYVYV